MNSTKDLLRGKITVQLISLILPLIIGNILQQFYNTIDSMIVGRYVGNTAFAAVGVAGSVMNLFIFMLNGGCNGISIIFAELYGQKKWERLRRESFLLAGMPITFFYNCCAAMLQAAGDTKTPLYTLLIAMALNTVLDLVFAAEFHMGTSGTAMATVTAQLAASVSCVCVMKKKHSEFFFHSKDLIMDEYLMKKTAKFGLVSALHQTSVYKGYKQDKIEMRGDRAEMSDFPLYLNTVAGGLDRRDQTIGGFSFVVKIYAVPVVEIIG